MLLHQLFDLSITIYLPLQEWSKRDRLGRLGIKWEEPEIRPKWLINCKVFGFISSEFKLKIHLLFNFSKLFR